MPWFNKVKEIFKPVGKAKWEHDQTVVLVKGVSGSCTWKKVQSGYKEKTITPRKLCYDKCKGIHFKFGKSRVEKGDWEDKVVDTDITPINWLPAMPLWIAKCDRNWRSPFIPKPD